MKMTKIVCFNCGKECEKPTKEINRQLKSGKVNFYCSLSCSASKIQTTTTIIQSNCLWCNKKFKTTTHKKRRKCCNKICSYKYAQSFVNYDNTSNSMKEYYRLHPKQKMYPIKKSFHCCFCGNIFEKLVNDNFQKYKTCNRKCYLGLLSKNSRENPNCGGELGYKHYDYNGVKMDSTWEVNLAKWMDENNIKWKRSRKLYMFWWTDNCGNKRRYYPDFYLPDYDLYLDPKNKYKLSNDQYKLDRVLEENKIKLLYGDLENIKNNIDKFKCQ